MVGLIGWGLLAGGILVVVRDLIREQAEQQPAPVPVRERARGRERNE